MSGRGTYGGGGTVPPDCFFETAGFRRARRRLFDGHPSNTAVLGEVRAGKSSTIDALVRLATRDHADRFCVAPLRVAEATRPYRNTVDVILLALRDALDEAWGLDSSKELASGTAPSRLAARLRVAASERRAQTGQFTLVVIEDLDALPSIVDPATLEQDMRVLRDLFENPATTGLVSLVSSRRSLVELEEMCRAQGSRFFTLYGSPAIWLGLLEVEETTKFLHSTRRGLDAEREALVRLVGRHPACLSLALHELDEDRPLAGVSAATVAGDRRYAFLWDAQRELYQQWQMRLKERGPHTGDLWGALLGLAAGFATEHDAGALTQLEKWGYVEPVPEDPSRSDALTAYGFRPFGELFDHYLRIQPTPPARHLYTAIGELEDALRRTVAGSVLRLERTTESADEVVGAWLRRQAPALARELVERSGGSRFVLSSTPGLGGLEHTYLREVVELFERSEVFGQVPEPVRREMSAKEWRAALGLIVQVRNAVAHYRVLRSDVHDQALAVCRRVTVCLRRPAD